MNENEILEQIITKINDYEEILIYRHENPDGDALGSQFGLRDFIKENFPNKKVYAIGSEKISSNFQKIFPSFDKYKGNYQKSLAIVLDTANINRINNSNYLKSKFIIKIDHHDEYDKYGSLIWQSTIFSSVCEMISKLIFSKKNFNINENIGKYLLTGMITDTDRFKFDNTTAQTLELASKFYGSVDLKKLIETLYEKSLEQFKMSAKILNKTKFKNNVAIFVMKKSFSKKHNFKNGSPKLYINELLNPSEIEYLIFSSYDFDKKIWKGSLRSKNTPIDQLAIKYGGGGHPKASGFAMDSKKQLNSLIKDLKKLAKDNRSE